MPENQPIRSKFKDFEVNTKIKLAFLWTAVPFCYLYGDYFELYTPGKVEGLISGDNLLNTPLNLLMATVMLAIPALMIVVSIFLRPAINRIFNMIFGLIFTLIMLNIVIGATSEWYRFYFLLGVIEMFITLMIIRVAYSWPKN